MKYVIAALYHEKPDCILVKVDRTSVSYITKNDMSRYTKISGCSLISNKSIDSYIQPDYSIGTCYKPSTILMKEFGRNILLCL